jgi:asparagine synthase (glutamine-hydrolysing)
MCGIAGIVSDNISSQKILLTRAVDSLVHRGPDKQSTYFFGICGLGHTRLSIVDLDTGDQPMLTQDKKIGVVFNGEIYGYKKIKSSIPDFEFRTTADTEVILALYRTYGKKMMDKLPGMFAFALWDENTQELFCGRDRFGEKPFYYAIGKHGEFIFASEIKAILVTGLVDPILDTDSLVHYLQHLYVHPTKTIYKNIFVLPPAHTLKYAQGKIEISRYWFVPTVQDTLEIEEATSIFAQLLGKSVQNQMIADVPIGAFLSGGVDSSTIVAEASKYTTKLQTFSFGFEQSLDELPFARRVSNMYRTDHTELFEKDVRIADVLVSIQTACDEPFADSSFIPTYIMSKLAKEHVTVVLTGDGGDELLGGYRNWYRPLYVLEQAKNLDMKNVFLSQFASILKFGLTFDKDFLYTYRGLNFFKKGLSIPQAHQLQNTYFSSSQLKKLLRFSFYSENAESLAGAYNNTLSDAMRMDVENYMPGDILVKIDRASMAHGLELRAPFLDVDFASFCMSLPSRLKITSDTDKYILRKAYESSWPSTVAKRSKQGFGAPVANWLKSKEVIELKNVYLKNNNNKIFKYISIEFARPYIEANNYQTWILLMLSMWMESHDFIV